MNTQLEDRLRATFDEMIPRLIEDIDVVEVVGSPPRRRSWVGAGVLAVAASVVALAFVVGRDDDRHTTTGVTDTTTPMVDAPAWYPILRAAVPDRFQYLAATAVGIDGASFVAINPDDGQALEIVITQNSTSEWTTEVTCDLDKGSTLFAIASPSCDGGGGNRTESTELDQISAAIPAAQLFALVERPNVTTDGQAVLDLLSGAVQHGDLVGMMTAEADSTFDFGTQNATSTRVRLVADVYPRPQVRIQGSIDFHPGAIAFWTVDPSGYAVRFTSTDMSESSLRTIADQVLDLVTQTVDPSPSTTSTVVEVQPGNFSATYGPIALGDGTSIRVRVDPNGICTLLADGTVGGCDGLVMPIRQIIVLWGNGPSLQTVYGIVQTGYSLSVANADGSEAMPVALTDAQSGWRAFAFQQPVGSQTQLVVTDSSGNNVGFHTLCC